MLCDNCGGEFTNLPLLQGYPICGECIKAEEEEWGCTFEATSSGYTVRNVFGERVPMPQTWEREPDAPCCPDPGCSGRPCTFAGYAANH